MDYLRWAKETFAKDIYATETTGIVIEEVRENYAKCSFETGERHLNAANGIMGGAIFTLADFAFAIASNTEGRLTVSMNSQINYLNPVKGTRVIAEAICVKSGKSVCLYMVDITDDLGTHVATVSATGFRKSTT